jgi:hypothetical protein
MSFPRTRTLLPEVVVAVVVGVGVVVSVVVALCRLMSAFIGFGVAC